MLVMAPAPVMIPQGRAARISKGMSSSSTLISESAGAMAYVEKDDCWKNAAEIHSPLSLTVDDPSMRRAAEEQRELQVADVAPADGAVGALAAAWARRSITLSPGLT